MPGKSQLPFFLENLSKTLSEKKDEYPSFGKLEDAIYQANNKLRTVERRKLARLVQRKEKLKELMQIPLSVNELLALDVFLKPEGGLAAVFERRSILRSLVEQRRVSFLLGAKSFEDTDHISLWDVRAMTEIQRGIYQLSRYVHMDSIDMYLRDLERDNLNPDNYQDLFPPESRYRLFEDRNAPSFVCVGSPRACNAAELMLARMLNVKPFTPGTAAIDAACPFKFVWADSEYENIPSSFAIRERDVPNPNRNQDVNTRNQQDKIRALIADGVRYDVHFEEPSWDTYGIIAISRRPYGQLWVVCAGLSGTATLAAARLLKTIAVERVPEEPTELSTVNWYVVKAKVERGEKKRGDNRQVIDQKIVKSFRLSVPKQ